MKNLTSLSVFFPAYNDAGTIASMALSADLAARALTEEYEIIIVNDGSQDQTALILTELQKYLPRLRVITHPRNLGYGAALRSGFSAATRDWVFYTDGDAQYNPLEMSILAEALRPGVDWVNGYKISRNDPLIRIVLGAVYNWGVKLAFGLRPRDVDCDFRLLRREIFAKIHLESETGSICVEMIKKMQDAGFTFAEVPVSHFHRQYGVSQFFNWRRLLRTAQHLLQLWWQLVAKR